MKTRSFLTPLSSTIFMLLGAVALAQSTWTGGGAPDGNFSNTANWNTPPNPSAGNTLNFDGSVNLNATNDLTLTTADQAINFNTGASAFTLWGNTIRAGGIANNSSFLQTINMGLNLNGTRTFNVGSAGILLGRPVGSTGTGTRTVTVSGSGALIVTGTATPSGGGANYSVSSGSLVFSNSTGQTTSTGGGGISLAGSGTTLQFNNAGTVRLGGVITTVSGSTVALNSTGNVTTTNTAATLLTIASGASLTGVGNLSGAVSISGTVMPGISGIGTISVASLTLAPGSLTILDIDREATQKADLISASGTITFAGTLQVNNLGAALQAGDVFDLFQASAYSGTFSNFDLPTLDPGLTWDVSQLDVTGTIAVAPVPEPATAALLGVGAVAWLAWRRRKI
ncbi:MAG TPA: PEP-CTERM sorting domain-containing protein [Verrucomicrobiae bacterium]|nr:PEP-CTERM sorting domain-containing protein [Verrucomicrobiae bacterium]